VLNGKVSLPGINTGIPTGAKRLLIDGNGTVYAADTTAGGGSISSASGTGISLVNVSSQIKRLKAGDGIKITDNTDSVTISRITDSTAIRNQRWKYRNTFELMEEFLGNGLPNGWVTSISGTGAGASTAYIYANIDSTIQGAIQFTTGTTTTGKASIIYGNSTSSNTGSLRGANIENTIIEFKVRIKELSTASEEYSLLLGFIDWTANAFYQNGVKFVYDRATYGDYWVLRSDDGGTSTVVTNTPVTANTNYILRIEINNWMMGSSGGSVRAYINDTEVTASSGTYPIVSNIDKSSSLYPCAWIQKSAGTTARLMHTDWIYMNHKFIKR
jgi:hypothetical protein